MSRGVLSRALCVCVFEAVHRFLPSVALGSGGRLCVREHPSGVLGWFCLLTVCSGVVHPSRRGRGGQELPVARESLATGFGIPSSLPFCF